jgi:hypothetical protein
MPHLPDHVTHDPELIAAYAAGDAAGPALDAAAELVAGCPECAELHRDLRAISTALPELPAPVRRRDFRLTPEQADALRPTGWRGVLAAFASPRFRLAAPLGTGLAAAGLAGLLLASPGGLLPASSGEAPSAAGAPAAAQTTTAADERAAAGAAAASAGTTGQLAPERIDEPKASAAASALEAPVPGAFAPDASPAAASPLTDTLHALGSTPASTGGRTGVTSNEAAPSSAAAAAPTDARNADDAGRETAGGQPLAPSTSDRIADSPAVPFVAAVLLLTGLALIALRLVARRVA